MIEDEDDELDDTEVALKAFLQNLSVQTILPVLLRVVFFLPWCVLVGGAIVMFPRNLELVVFRPGYVKSPRGVHRFKHFADTGVQHVWIFFGFVASVLWLFPTTGWLLVSHVVSLAIYEWHNFRVDRSIPLGEDDRQTVYLVVTAYGIPDEFMDIRRVGDGYVIEKLEKPRSMVDESDDEYL